MGLELNYDYYRTGFQKTPPVCYKESILHLRVELPVYLTTDTWGESLGNLFENNHYFLEMQKLHISYI